MRPLLQKMAVGTLIGLGVLGGRSADARQAVAIVGTWQLKSYVLRSSNGSTKQWCKSPFGLLTYTKAGYVHAAINCRQRSPDFMNVQREIPRIFYAGKYVQNSEHQILHYVFNSDDLSIVGQTLVRNVKFEKGELVITGKGVRYGEFELHWVRLQSGASPE